MRLMAVKVALGDSEIKEFCDVDLHDVSLTPLKLPALPKEHIKSISGSLPGKLIGRIAALLAFVAIALAWWALIENWLPAPLAGLRNTAPWVFHGIVYALPVGVIVFQLGRETWDRWHTRKIRERVISGEVIEPAYFRLTPYTARDHGRFRRADGIHLAVLSWIDRMPNIRSSILRARLAPGRVRCWKLIVCPSCGSVAGRRSRCAVSPIPQPSSLVPSRSPDQYGTSHLRNPTHTHCCAGPPTD